MRKIAATLLTLSVLVAGCGGAKNDAPSTPAPQTGGTPGAEAPQHDGKLVISGFGFGADEFRETVIKPFEEKYGVEVTMEVGNNADRLNKLKAQRNNPVVDVILISDYFSEIGQQEGLFAKIDPENVPNLANIYDFAVNPEGYGPAYTQNRLGVIYNPEKVPGGAITSWKDLWNPALEGYVAVPDMTVSYGPLFLGAAAVSYGSGVQDAEAGFEALINLKPSVLQYFTRTSEMTSLLERGEVWAAPTLDLFVVGQQQSGKFEWVIPQEGSFRLTNLANVVAGTKRQWLAEKFIDHLLDKETQEAAALAFSDAPVNKLAELPAELGQYLAYGENATNNVSSFDQALLVANQQKWVDRFMREVAN